MHKFPGYYTLHMNTTITRIDSMAAKAGNVVDLIDTMVVMKEANPLPLMN